MQVPCCFNIADGRFFYLMVPQPDEQVEGKQVLLVFLTAGPVGTNVGDRLFGLVATVKGTPVYREVAQA